MFNLVATIVGGGVLSVPFALKWAVRFYYDGKWSLAGYNAIEWGSLMNCTAVELWLSVVNGTTENQSLLIVSVETMKSGR